MYYSTLTSAAVLLALAPAALAGSATVVNNCGFPVYMASVAQNGDGTMHDMGSSYTESYGADNVGVSIKLSPSMGGKVTQFEITPSGGKIFYDMSNIDGNPFAADGMSLVPSMTNDPANPTCQAVDCPAGQSSCSAAYNNPDDVRTTVCNAASNLVLTICPGGSGTTPTTSQPSASAAASSAPAATSAAPAASPSATAGYNPPRQVGGWTRYHARHLLRK